MSYLSSMLGTSETIATTLVAGLPATRILLSVRDPVLSDKLLPWRYRDERRSRRRCPARSNTETRRIQKCFTSVQEAGASSYPWYARTDLTRNIRGQPTCSGDVAGPSMDSSESARALPSMLHCRPQESTENRHSHH